MQHLVTYQINCNTQTALRSGKISLATMAHNECYPLN